jgi:hypothetical protein
MVASTTGAGSGADQGLVEVLRIFLIFLLIGPLIGTIVFTVLYMTANIGTLGMSGLLGAPQIIILGLLTGASYVLGGIPAAIAGLIVAIKNVYFGGIGWRSTLGTGLSVGIALGIFAVFVMHDAGHFALLLGITAMLSTLACWCLAKRWFRAPA